MPQFDPKRQTISALLGFPGVEGIYYLSRQTEIRPTHDGPKLLMAPIRTNDSKRAKVFAPAAIHPAEDYLF
jgi:hypothetical protein